MQAVSVFKLTGGAEYAAEPATYVSAPRVAVQRVAAVQAVEQRPKATAPVVAHQADTAPASAATAKAASEEWAAF